MSVLDPLYRDTITLFNRYDNVDGSYTWIPTIMRGVHFITSKAVMVTTYGDNHSDNAQVNIIYQKVGKKAMVSGKTYVQPKEYKRLTLSQAKTHFTFSCGGEFDFVYGGVWTGAKEIADNDYPKGFYNHMQTTYDDVYAITSSAMYYLLPHFSITAK